MAEFKHKLGLRMFVNTSINEFKLKLRHWVYVWVLECFWVWEFLIISIFWVLVKSQENEFIHEI